MQLYANMKLYATMQLYETMQLIMFFSDNMQLYATMKLMQLYATLWKNATYATICNCVGTTNVYWHDNKSFHQQPTTPPRLVVY